MQRGEVAWMILAGEFPNRETAMATLQKWPSPLADSPFLRSVGKMRKVVLGAARE
jgi:MSHA biogenesis protein MshM